MPNIQTVSPQRLKESLVAGCLAIDVREPGEIRAEAVEGIRALPLSGFPSAATDLEKGREIYILCKSGRRAQTAASHLARMGHEKIFVVEGGIEGWKAQGFATLRATRALWSLERQVRFTAGLLVVVGGAIGWFFHPGGWFLSMGVALGLMVSAATDTCPMGTLLAACPWNRSSR